MGEYVFGSKIRLFVKIILILFIVVGAALSIDLVWEISDTFNILMAIPNLTALILLSGTIAKITKNYLDRKKNVNIEPMLSYDEKENELLSSELSDENELLEIKE